MKPKKPNYHIEKWKVISGIFQGYTFNGTLQMFLANGKFAKRHKRIIDCDSIGRSFKLKNCERVTI